MPELTADLSISTLLSYAALGLIVGFGYYTMALTRFGLPDDTQPVLIKVLSGMRIAAAAIFFAWLASLGMLPILSAFVGFLVGRVIAFQTLGIDA